MEGASPLKTTSLRCFHRCHRQRRRRVEAELGGADGGRLQVAASEIRRRSSGCDPIELQN
jgi:hypothetical protein